MNWAGAPQGATMTLPKTPPQAITRILILNMLQAGRPLLLRKGTGLAVRHVVQATEHSGLCAAQQQVRGLWSDVPDELEKEERDSFYVETVESVGGGSSTGLLLGCRPGRDLGAG